ncbi:MAG: thiamine pyrophosphate-dependent enzyme [Conexivisphaerales archaeon]
MLKIDRIRSFSEEQLGLHKETDIETLLYKRIDEEGSIIGEEPSLQEEQLKTMYRLMVYARLLDEQMTRLSTFREIGTYAPFRGQEAAQIGYSMAMEANDWLVPMYRDTGALVARGVPAEQLFLYWAGDERGMAIPEGLKILPIAIAVGTQVPQAAGLALANKLRKTGSVVITTTGDGGTSKGDFHEGLNMAGSYSLPLVTIVENNQYAISMPRSQQTASKTIAQKAVAYGIEGLLVDGNDAVAVYEATRYAVEKAREGEGPTLIELYTYRMGVHTTAELVSHKLQPQEELAKWEKKDPILRLEKYLLSRRIINSESVQEVRDEAASRVKQAVDTFRKIEPPDPKDIFRYTYARMTKDQALQMKEAFGSSDEPYQQIQEESASSSKTRQGVNIRNAINMALRQEMELNERIVIFGEDVGRNGGVFQVTKGLQDDFGMDRVFDTPLAELGIAGLFLGLSVGGLIPVAEFQFDGFTPPAYDQIFNNIARFRNRSRGRYNVRGVIRFPYGGGLHAPELHLDSPETYFVHTPGLKVVIPSNPYDAKGLLASSLAEEDPVIFMEPKRFYDTPRIDVPEERYLIPLGKSKLVRKGEDVTLVTYGAMLYSTMEAADAMSKEGRSCDVIDLRTLSPLDFDAIRASVEKTGRLVIVHEAPKNLGMGAEIAARIADESLLYLKAPVKRVTGYDVVNPLSRLQKYYIPDSERILKAVRQTLEF